MDVDEHTVKLAEPIADNLVAKDSLDDHSSEDEGIFLSKNQEGLRIERIDVSHEVNLSEDSDDDVNGKVKVARRKNAILSDGEESGTGGSGLTSNIKNYSSAVSSDEEDALIFRKLSHQKPALDDEDSVSNDASPSEAPCSPLPTKRLYQYNSDLYDAEISDEEESRLDSPEHSDNEEKPIVKIKKEQRPTYKDRENNARTIHSESQRMVRESDIALPYHKPKQRSLREFLSRRKKATPPVAMAQRSIKMSMKNLETLRLLEQKRKEVEDFYKSDSDHEDPDDKDWTPDIEELPEESNISKEMNFEKEEALTDSEIRSRDNEIENSNHVSSKMNEHNCLEVLPSKINEEEHLPDLIIEKVPKSVLERDQHQPMINVAESNTDEPSSLMADCGNLRINNEDINGSMPSQEGFLSVYALEGSLNKENLEPTETDIMQKGNNGNNRMAANQKEKEGAGIYGDGEGTHSVPSVEESDKGNSDARNFTTDNKLAMLVTPKLSKFSRKLPDMLLDKIAVSTPKLSLGEGDYIDFDDEDASPTPESKSGIHELMDRFVKHTNSKKKPRDKKEVQLSVVSKEKDSKGKEKLVASNVVVNIAEEESVKVSEPVPGASMVLLKTALQSKIREKREQERLRKVKEKQFLETEQVMKDYHDDGTLPNEEEFSDQSESEYETESEPEENDIVIKDKKRQKNAFLDDEAEEEDDMDVSEAKNDDGVVHHDSQVDEDSNDTVGLPDLEEENSGRDESRDNDQLRLQWEDTEDIKLTPQIDSLEHNSSITSNADFFTTPSIKKGESVDKDSMDSSFELFGSVIPAHQPGGGLKHGHNEQRSESDNDTGFLTPLTRSKSSFFDPTKECDLSLPIENTQDLFDTSMTDISAHPSPSPVNLHLTPLKDSQFPLESEKEGNSTSGKLKLDFTNLENSQENDELAGLCSGKFTASEPVSKKNDLCDDDLPPTQDINDLMGLCSGKFTSQVDEESDKEFKMPAAFSILSENQEKPNETENDEELLGLCSGQFTLLNREESSHIRNSLTSFKDRNKDDTIEAKTEHKITAEPQMIVMSSDDESSNVIIRTKTKKKRRRIIAFSDDEDAQDAIEYDGEEEQDAVDYDEESEVVLTTFTGFKDKIKGGIRADFIEQEAELSDEEFDVSDDEEEKGEDELEMEEADLEAFDENELRDQVGRAHLKTLLDSDKREIRLLQEMYLEDGELHGEGRQRQFRWKNVDVDDDIGNRILSDNEGGDEDDPEDAAWRKERFEREKFLKDQQEKIEQTEVGNVFTFGKKTLLRSTSLTTEAKKEPLKESNSTPTLDVPARAVPQANPYSIMAKRGSFLSRDKSTLARIAELTKEKGSSVGTANQAGNFVFQHLSAEEIQEKEEKAKSLKKSTSLPAAKRTKRDRSFFSMDASSQSSSIFSQLQ